MNMRGKQPPEQPKAVVEARQNSKELVKERVEKAALLVSVPANSTVPSTLKLDSPQPQIMSMPGKQPPEQPKATLEAAQVVSVPANSTVPSGLELGSPQPQIMNMSGKQPPVLPKMIKASKKSKKLVKKRVKKAVLAVSVPTNSNVPLCVELSSSSQDSLDTTADLGPWR